MSHQQPHKIHRTGWLRAAVLGANDGIVSTASLIIGVSAAGATHYNIMIAGVAGLVAGAMSMAAGEYVSVCSQADTEKADLEIEKKSIRDNEDGETQELANIYENRGLSPDLAMEVAKQLMAHDALGTHARDDIGITDHLTAKPIEAAATSAAMFSIGSALPLITAWFTPINYLILAVALFSLLFLSSLGGVAAYAGGASALRGAARVAFWGAIAMALTAGIGKLFGVTV